MCSIERTGLGYRLLPCRSAPISRPRRLNLERPLTVFWPCMRSLLDLEAQWEELRASMLEDRSRQSTCPSIRSSGQLLPYDPQPYRVFGRNAAGKPDSIVVEAPTDEDAKILALRAHHWRSAGHAKAVPRKAG